MIPNVMPCVIAKRIKNSNEIPNVIRIAIPSAIPNVVLNVP